MSMSLKKEYILKYKTVDHICFIESGTYVGDAVSLSLECGFEKVISVEISYRNYKQAFDKFVINSNVELIHGDSYYEFPKICNVLNTPSFFWLDGHSDKFCDTIGVTKSPLIQEIRSIGLSPVKNHIIVVDDLRLFGNDHETDWGLDLSLDIIKCEILKINPNYKFYYEDGWSKNDILFAII